MEETGKAGKKSNIEINADKGAKQNSHPGREEWPHLIRIGVMVFVTFAVSILFFFALYRFEGFAGIWSKLLAAAMPIIMGLVLAYLMNPVMLWLERCFKKLLSKKMKSESKLRKVSRALAITGSVIILVAIISLLIAAIVPSVIASISGLMKTLPNDVAAFINMIKNGNFGDSKIAELASTGLQNATDYIENYATEKLIPEAQKYVAQITTGVISVVRGLFNFIIGIIVMVYVMSIQETLAGQSKKIIYAVCKPKTGNIIIETIRKTNEIFGGFISGKIIDSLIIGVIAYFGCLILRIPSSVLVAVIIGVTNVIPVFGPFIGAVPGIVILFIIHPITALYFAIPSLLIVVIQSPWHALYLLIFIVVLQQVDGNIIGPKILGSSTGLSTFWVMFAILIGGGMFGFLGMLLGVPTFAVIYYIVKRVVNYALRKKKLPEDTRDYTKTTGVDTKNNKLKYE